MIQQRLLDAAPIVLDGGLATQIETQGFHLNSDLWSAELLASDPGAIVDAHRAYLDAGAECIISASYQASRDGLVGLGLTAAQADELITSSVTLARQAVDEFCAARSQSVARPLVAASVGPYGAAMHDGSEYTGLYAIDAASLAEFHRQRLAILDAAGADVLACETIPNRVEADVLAELLRDVRTPAWISFSCRNGTEISDGTPIADIAEIFADHPRVLAVGVNCTAPEFIPSLIANLRSTVGDKAIVIYPNSGERFTEVDKTWHGSSSPVNLAEASASWFAAGASIIGGCCRMGPDEIKIIRRALKP